MRNLDIQSASLLTLIRFSPQNSLGDLCSLSFQYKFKNKSAHFHEKKANKGDEMVYVSKVEIHLVGNANKSAPTTTIQDIDQAEIIDVKDNKVRENTFKLL